MKVQTSGSEKRLTIEEGIIRDTDELAAVLRSIQGTINDIPVSSCHLVLEKRHITFLKWEDIASELRWTRIVFYVHWKALHLVNVPT